MNEKGYGGIRMSERGIWLVERADRQLSEMIEFFGTLDEGDLPKPCLDGSAEDRPGDTVAAVAAHTAEGYHHLGSFLRATGFRQRRLFGGRNRGCGCRSTSLQRGEIR